MRSQHTTIIALNHLSKPSGYFCQLFCLLFGLFERKYDKNYALLLFTLLIFLASLWFVYVTLLFFLYFSILYLCFLFYKYKVLSLAFWAAFMFNIISFIIFCMLVGHSQIYYG
jgi:hypothetical protein